MTVKHFTATKALIRRSGKILIVRESSKYKDGSNIGLYDVPGGRIDPGETLLQGLTREISEETGLQFSTGIEFFSDSVTVPRKDEAWHIERHYFICDIPDGDVVLGTDHDDFKWIDPNDHANANLINNLNIVFQEYLKKSA